MQNSLKRKVQNLNNINTLPSLTSGHDHRFFPGRRPPKSRPQSLVMDHEKASVAGPYYHLQSGILAKKKNARQEPVSDGLL